MALSIINRVSFGQLAQQQNSGAFGGSGGSFGGSGGSLGGSGASFGGSGGSSGLNM